MEFLSGILRENYQQLNTATFIEAVGKEPKIKSMDFELVFRGVLEDIISRTSVGEVHRISPDYERRFNLRMQSLRQQLLLTIQKTYFVR